MAYRALKFLPKTVDKPFCLQYTIFAVEQQLMREWLRGGAPPCQGGGRGFESRLALFLFVGRKPYFTRASGLFSLTFMSPCWGRVGQNFSHTQAPHTQKTEASSAPVFCCKRVMGIEPTYPAWKAGVLPLNYTRREFRTNFRKNMPRTGIEPVTRGFSVLCSTN